MIRFAGGSPLTCFLSVFLYPGIVAQLEMPQTSMDVIKGRMVTLKASYSTALGSDVSSNTVLWNFVTNNTQLVRKGNGKVIPTAQESNPLPSVAIVSGTVVVEDVC